MSKKYFIDLDNTLCSTQNSDYENSLPITDRISYVNSLRRDGHHITIWTARGSNSKQDYMSLTVKQLAEWGIEYDRILLGKPCYDLYIDDKSFNVDSHWPVPTPENAPPVGMSKKQEVEIVPKGWGKEIIFVNNEEYCGKLLCFDAGKKFSMHYHLQKKETWYVSKGKFILVWIEPQSGVTYCEYLNKGEVITNERGAPHQLIALEDSEVFEVSTRHYDSDSYRIWKGN